MRVAVIINPVAGGPNRATARDRRDAARAWLEARTIRGDVELTTGHGHAADLARAYVRDGVDRVIAWGGDGTANEVAGPLIGTTAVLGLVPAGSGDGLARSIGLPADPAEALAVAVGDRTMRLDVGWLGDRHFLNVGGFGFDAAVARAFEHDVRRGPAGYVRAGLRCLRSYRAAPCTVDLDGAVLAGAWFLVAFANGREYGNGFVLAPDGDPCDGLLDVVVVETGSRLRQLWRARSLLLKKTLPVDGVRRHRARRAVVSSAAGLVAHVDGEPFAPGSPVAVRVDAGAIRLAVAPTPRAGG